MRYCFTVALFIASLFGTTSASAQVGLSFAEIMPNPAGTDTKTNEYVKLKNYSAGSLSLEGDKICNVSNDCYNLKGEIAAGACLKIFRTDFVFTLHNDKEELDLFDSDNNIVSQITTGTAPSGQAWLCSDTYCQWDDPRETCDYSDIVDPASLPPTQDDDNENINENTNENINNNGGTNDNSENHPPTEPAGNNTNVNSNVDNNANTNSAVSKPAKKVFQIFSQKDWSKVKKEMDRKNLLSLAADVQGNILIPLNIVKANTFYLSASGNLVPVNIYPSRQADFERLSPLYRAGSRILVGQGYLKNSSGAWQLGVGKNTQLKTKNKPADNKSEAVKTVKVAGKVLRKSGQYFYVEDPGNKSRIITVFIPDVIWTRYLEKEKIGSFPQLVNNKIVTGSDIKGKNIELAGIRETSGNTERVIVTSENDIQLEKERVDNPKPAGKEEEKTDKKEIAPEPSPPDLTPSDPTNLRNENTQNSPAEKPPSAKSQSLGQILARKLSWLNLWTITLAKIKDWGVRLF